MKVEFTFGIIKKGVVRTALLTFFHVYKKIDIRGYDWLIEGKQYSSITDKRTQIFNVWFINKIPKFISSYIKSLFYINCIHLNPVNTAFSVKTFKGRKPLTFKFLSWKGQLIPCAVFKLKTFWKVDFVQNKFWGFQCQPTLKSKLTEKGWSKTRKRDSVRVLQTIIVTSRR